MRRIVGFLRRTRPLLLAGAALDLVALLAALIHDFQLADSSGGWLTGRPAVAGALLVVGYLLMVGYQVAGRGEE